MTPEQEIEYRYTKDLTNLLLILLFVLGSVVLSSCYTKKTALRQVSRAHNTYPEVPAKFCAEMYDPTDSVHILKEYIQGEDVIMLDTVTEYFYDHSVDTVFATKYITKTVKVVDTLRDTKYIKVENKAALVVKDADIKRLTNTVTVQAEDIKDKSRENWVWRIAFGLYIIWRVIKWKFLKK